jgi:5-hydroxyisourate hydrolase
MSAVTTHVLDTALGRPGEGIAVALLDSAGRELGAGVTDADGRIRSLGPELIEPGTYRLIFATGPYFAAAGRDAFFPEVTITFAVRAAGEHYHVPILLSPFAFSTYRGS